MWTGENGIFQKAYVMVWCPARDLKWRMDISLLFHFWLGLFSSLTAFLEINLALLNFQVNYVRSKFNIKWIFWLLIAKATMKRLDRGRRQTRPRRFWVSRGLTSVWWDNFVAQVSCDRFQILFGYSCGRVKTIQKRNRVEGTIFENEEKNLRFQTKTDT